VRRLLTAQEAAEAALEEGLAVARNGPQVPAEVMLRAELALLAADRGRLEAGRTQLARCHEIMRAGEDWRGLAGRVALAAGVLRAAGGDTARAGKAFAAAVRSFRAHECPWDEAEARCLWAKALPAQAKRQRGISADLYHRIGAGQRWVAWATAFAG
jgi:ATP/maltotriose-dependent transcriptional regulator MalT